MKRTFTVIGPQGFITFTGELLGETTSHQPEHFHEPGALFARKNERCYACRWSEYQLFRIESLDQRSLDAYGNRYAGRYLVASFGNTTVPGESVFRRVEATDSPAEVIELLTTRKYGQPPVITTAAARLLARVSDLDEKIQEAWDNRAVL